jgi:cobalt/nickel transport system ATP-binding protein
VRPVVDVKNLRYAYEDGTVAVDGVDFQLQPNETVVLLGANGSGKTTFALHLNGLLTGQGSVAICGLPVDPKHLGDVRRLVGLVFQDSDEQLFMPTVLEDVAFGPLNLGLPPDDAAAIAKQALTRVAMDHALGKAPYHLSAGEKKRVAIAGVLAMSPEILVLDEPTTYLDPPGRRDLLRILRELPQAKIVVTHDVAFARAIASRAVFFQKGRIVADGPVDEIVRQFNWSAD